MWIRRFAQSGGMHSLQRMLTKATAYAGKGGGWRGGRERDDDDDDDEGAPSRSEITPCDGRRDLHMLIFLSLNFACALRVVSCVMLRSLLQ